MMFSSDLLKRWSFQKGPCGRMIFLVPFSPQGLYLGVCLGTNKGNYLSIKG